MGEKIVVKINAEEAVPSKKINSKATRSTFTHGGGGNSIASK
jgi:hypothetical protein